MEIIVGIVLLLSLAGNVVQHNKIESQELTIENMSVALEQSIDGANHNANILVETNDSLETCIFDLQETRKLQADFERIIESAEVDNKILEADLIRTDWGSTSIPWDIDF